MTGEPATRTPRRRRRRIVAVVLVGLLLAAAAALWWRLPPDASDLAPVPTGALQLEVQGQWSVGGFQVLLDADDGQLRVTHDDALVAPWETPPGEAFLTAAAGDPSFRDDYGLLRIADTHRATWTEQVVTTVEEQDGALLLEGALSDDAGAGGDAGGAGDLPWSLTLHEPAPGRLDIELVVDATAGAPRPDRLHLAALLAEDERVMGMGGQTGSYDLRGRRVPVLAREQGIGRGAQPLSLLVDLAAAAAGGEDTAYLVSAVHLTDRFRSLVYRDTAISSLDLTASDRLVWEVWSDRAGFTAVAAASPDQVLELHATWTGTPTQPPEWTQQGLIAGLQGGTEQVRAKVALLQDAEVPLAGVWLQDWVGQRTVDFGDRLQWNWVLDTDRYPGWDTLVDELAADGIRVLTYASPFLSPDSGAASARAGGRDLFAEAEAAGYLVVDTDGATVLEDQRGFDAALVDLTHPEAREWLAEVLVDEVLGVGASGFMADFSEGPPPDSVLYAGDGLTWRAAWPVLWQEVVATALERTGMADDALVFHRTTHSRSVGAADAVWLGDQNQDWTPEDGLASVPSLLASASASGLTHVHGDVGGYTSLALPVLSDVARDDELVLRWAEALLLNPVLRTHEGNRPDAVAQPAEDPELAGQLASIVRLFVALAPERARLAAASPFGLAQHHPWWHDPEDLALIGAADELLQLGPDLVLAPVLEPEADTVEARLPAGRWVHVMTGEMVDGGLAAGPVAVAAPVGSPALFAREGSLVAGELADHLAAEAARG